MKSLTLDVKKFPVHISENELNADYFDFKVGKEVLGWLPKKAILEAPTVMLGKITYYTIGKEFLEPITKDYIPKHDHEAEMWDSEKRAWECFGCGIYTNDAEMRRVEDTNYEYWRRDLLS